VESGSEWIVDADLKDFFGSVNHEKQIADSAVMLPVTTIMFPPRLADSRLKS
jgi:hypothetical protein